MYRYTYHRKRRTTTVNLFNNFLYHKCTCAMKVIWEIACGSSTAPKYGGNVKALYTLLERPAWKDGNEGKKTTDSCCCCLPQNTAIRTFQGPTPHARVIGYAVGQTLPGAVEAGGHAGRNNRADPFISCRGQCLQAHMTTFLKTQIGRATASSSSSSSSSCLSHRLRIKIFMFWAG